LIREEDQNHSWNYSHAPALIASWRSDGSNVSGVWLMRAERQKHRRKIKKRRDKMPHVRLQEEVSWTFECNLSYLRL
jgi:urease accessory protein UreE